MNKRLAFVLSGGGARGALQVGALRALLEAEIYPDLLVGTSAGAINATYLAIRGVRLESVETLAQDWQDAAGSDLLTYNYLWATLSSLLNRSGRGTYGRMRDFFIARGLTPDWRFGNIHGVQLIVVAADLNGACPVLYGTDSQQSVLEAVLASAALPPWVPPIEKDGQLLIDGGAVSNLPIEAALAHGATEIIALDLAESRDIPVKARGWLPFLVKLMNTAEQRQMELELALAAARSVPVRRVSLVGDAPVAIWDFHRSEELIARGYEIARREIARWQSERQPWWRKWLPIKFRHSPRVREMPNFKS
jgi:NTE family protein